MVWNRPSAIADANAISIRALFQVWGDGHKRTVSELDALVAPFVVKLIGFDEQRSRIERNCFAGVEIEPDGGFRDDPDDEQRGVFKWKIDFFTDIAAHLGDVVAIPVPPDGTVEVIDDALVFESAVAIVPPAPAVHPEDGIFFGDDHFGQEGIHA